MRCPPMYSLEDNWKPIFQYFNIKSHLIHGNDDKCASRELPSKYGKDQSVWIKLDPNTKWVPGNIIQILPNQSYEVTLMDGRIFRRNEHHITLRWQGAKTLNYLNHLIYLIPITWGQGENYKRLNDLIILMYKVKEMDWHIITGCLSWWLIVLTTL